jgi:hypothetical protein
MPAAFRRSIDRTMGRNTTLVSIRNVPISEVFCQFRMLMQCLISICIASKAEIAYFQIIYILQTVIWFILDQKLHC